MEMGSGTCFITLFQFPSIMRPSLFVPVPDFVHNHHPRHVALWASGCGVKTEVIFSSSGYKLHGGGELEMAPSDDFILACRNHEVG